MEETSNFYNIKKENKKEINIENKNLLKNFSLNRRKRIEIPTKITIFNPFNLKYMPSDKILILKEINKNYPINQSNKLYNTERNNFEKKIKRSNVKNTLNDIYNAINNINKLDRKIKNIISHSSIKNSNFNNKTESEKTLNNNIFEKNANINDPAFRSNSQIIKISGKNKIIYKNNEKNQNGYYTDCNDEFSERNKFKTTSLFRKPKYQASSSRTNYKNYFQYKNNFF